MKKRKRETFRTSREMDFFSARELVTQTGHEVTEWPLVVLKELIDNSLDACEEADIAPKIEVSADPAGLTVTDNGPGLPYRTIGETLDFTVRTSSREAYVSPTRGAQGNALKTLVTMPYVLDPDHGRAIVKSSGEQRVIRCGMDPVTQRAVIHCDATASNGKPGTMVRLEWSPREEDDEVSWPFHMKYTSCLPARNGRHKPRVFELLRAFAMFNPHLTLRVDWLGEKWVSVATDPAWRKWRPDHPTSPHWYEQRHFERLIGAYIALDQDRGTHRTVAAFVSEFDGLTGSQKRKLVLAECGLARAPLTELTDEHGFRKELVGKLLDSMRGHTRAVTARRLGVIGQDHLAAKFADMGCDPDQFKYCKKLGEEDGLPYVLETAFSWRGEGGRQLREFVVGANWSAAIKNPFRSFGATGEGLEAHLSELRAGAREPVVFLIHLAHPRIQFTDRGKSAIAISCQEEDDDE
jgi:hypothetical protein